MNMKIIVAVMSMLVGTIQSAQKFISILTSAEIKEGMTRAAKGEWERMNFDNIEHCTSFDFKNRDNENYCDYLWLYRYSVGCLSTTRYDQRSESHYTDSRCIILKDDKSFPERKHDPMIYTQWPMSVAKIIMDTAQEEERSLTGYEKDILRLTIGTDLFKGHHLLTPDFFACIQAVLFSRQ